jgi:hypothetical protein
MNGVINEDDMQNGDRETLDIKIAFQNDSYLPPPPAPTNSIILLRVLAVCNNPINNLRNTHIHIHTKTHLSLLLL